MKIGITIDKWKLKIFKKILTEKKFKFTEHQLPVITGCLVLKVDVEDVFELRDLVSEMNQAAMNSKLN